MFHDITLFIPTHNRHRYLDRILTYYATIPIKIIVADSSATPYTEKSLLKNIEYFHMPAENLPQKMARALKYVRTEFVVMCADDDFIVPDGIKACLEFLKSNREFIAAQGNCISYEYSNTASKNIMFSAMYRDSLSYEISLNNAFERIERLFSPYRTLFCAVHYTKNLQLAYNENLQINNLFLNEYLSGLIPICTGNFKELPLFYQVREYTENSGDKTTDNLDIIIKSEKYTEEYQRYLQYVSGIVCAITHSAETFVLQRINKVFIEFSTQLAVTRTSTQQETVKKKLGKIIKRVPFIGKRIILLNREAEKKSGLSTIIKSDQDRANLGVLEKLIKTYAPSIG